MKVGNRGALVCVIVMFATALGGEALVGDQGRPLERAIPVGDNPDAGIPLQLHNSRILGATVLDLLNEVGLKGGIELVNESRVPLGAVPLPRKPNVLRTAGRKLSDVVSDVTTEWTKGRPNARRPELRDGGEGVVHFTSFSGTTTALDAEFAAVSREQISVKGGLASIQSLLRPTGRPVLAINGDDEETRAVSGWSTVRLNGEFQGRTAREFLDFLVVASGSTGWIATYADTSGKASGLTICVIARAGERHCVAMGTVS